MAGTVPAAIQEETIAPINIKICSIINVLFPPLYIILTTAIGLKPLLTANVLKITNAINRLYPTNNPLIDPMTNKIKQIIKEAIISKLNHLMDIIADLSRTSYII
jgi:hypothetical protein